MENSANVDLQSVAVGRPKTSYDLSNPVKQTRKVYIYIYIYILELKYVTIGHSKTTTKLSNSTKQAKIDNLKPKRKIKVYAKSKAADSTLQLELINRYIQLKLKLTRS